MCALHAWQPVMFASGWLAPGAAWRGTCWPAYGIALLAACAPCPSSQACICATMHACCALQVLLQGSPAALPGGMLQLWLDGNFVLAALAGVGSDALGQAYSRLCTALDSRLEEALVAAEGGAQAAALAAWAQQGCSNARLAVPTYQQRLKGMLEEVQVAACSNLTSLRQLAASTYCFRS